MVFFVFAKDLKVSKHMKRCSILLVIMDMKIKTTLRYHLASIKIARQKKVREHKMLVRTWRNQNLHTLPAGMSNGKATVENRLVVPHMITELPSA